LNVGAAAVVVEVVDPRTPEVAVVEEEEHTPR